MLCLVGSQSILAPLGKAVFKGRRRRIQAASGQFRARFEGCVLRRLFLARVQLLELAWLSAAHIILVAEPQREEYQRCHATRRNARNGSENA